MSTVRDQGFPKILWYRFSWRKKHWHIYQRTRELRAPQSLHMVQRWFLDVAYSHFSCEVSRINRHHPQWRKFPFLWPYGPCPITSSSQNLVDNAQYIRSRDTSTLASGDWTIINKSIPYLQGMYFPSGCLRLCHLSMGQANVSITDNFLKNISQYLSQLEHLNLTGCRRVTNEGVWSIIRHNVRNIKELSLESLSPLFASLLSYLRPSCWTDWRPLTRIW